MQRALFIVCLVAAGCANPPLPGDPTGQGDLAVTPLDPALFVGRFTWQSGSTVTQVCDGNAMSLPAPTGDFMLGAGPGKAQVNIGAGMTMMGQCPVLIFDVGTSGATLTNVGVPCPSGPGTITTRGGTISTSDGGHSLAINVALDIDVASGGVSHHCALVVNGTVVRKP